ncbi:unnamed protein product [Nezara viridula]|uniref:Neuropeptide n=1 Tax=Nezara viridula TaxID=85310 RepID=A0A9P0GXQ1_NEZVI|nr:unnamed protein product [Nezara viridula]
MSNFGLNQFCVMILIICPCHIMEAVKLLENDISMITYRTHVHSKVLRRLLTDQKVPIEIRKRKRRSLLYRKIGLFNGTDNPNKEQKLMVDTFIKSSNGLFKSEMEAIDGKATGLEDSNVVCPHKFGLYKSRMESSAKIDTDSSQDKVIHSGRMKRYLFLDKVGTIRPLDQVRDGHGARRCDRDRNINRMRLPKERILRCGRRTPMRRLYTNGLHVLPKFKRRLRSSNNDRQVRYNRRDLKSKFNRFKKSFNRSDLGEVEDKALENMFILYDPHSDLKNSQFIDEKNRGKSRKVHLKKRDFMYGEPGGPLMLKRCTKPKPTVLVQSVNIGKTGRICFPSTHRCMKPKTCPCSVEYRKCPPRTTCCLQPETLCFESTETSTMSTVGRCQGIDTETPTPIEEGLCIVTPCLEGSKKDVRKRCACDCGCGCPHNLRRNHPDRALARGSCGCGCGCGCLHGGGAHCATSKSLT